jgi:ParB family chromosome partitioning protein
LSAGSAKSAGQARAAFIAREKGIEPSVKDPVEEAFNALAAIWSRAPMAAKRRFMQEFSDEIAAMEGHGE